VDHDTARAYLQRIGLTRADVGLPTADLLRELHRHHYEAVPFENLSIHLGEPIDLGEDALVDKIVGRRRGGFCYELNGLFGALLRSLGFTIGYHSARTYGGDGRLGIPFDHLALVVDLGERWIADVGFGRHATYPLLLDSSANQPDPGGVFQVRPASESDIVDVDDTANDVDVIQDGLPVYRMELRRRELHEFRIGAWWNSTSPESHFTRRLTCSRPDGDGRVTLAGRTLITTVGGERTETELADDAAVLDAYRTLFGIELDSVPEVRAANQSSAILV
jgi:N-hydroxyarylamine O-acetyltransferase